MGNPQISIIVPVYNAEKSIHRCMNSILSQTYTDFELLLVNDGSKDCSGKICDEYATKDNRVRVFHKENGGVSSARNVGLDNAIGEYLCFCDSDDFVDDDWLNGFVEYFPSKMIVQGFKWQNEKDEQWKTIKNELETIDLNEAMKSLFSRNNMGYLWCRCFCSSIITKFHIRFNEEYLLREDYDFIISYYTHIGKVSLSPFCSYNYYMPNFSGSKYNKIKIEEDIKCTLSILQNLFQIYGKNFQNDIVYSEIRRLRGAIFKAIVSGKNMNYELYMFQYEHYKKLSSVRPLNFKEHIKESFLLFWKYANANNNCLKKNRYV